MSTRATYQFKGNHRSDVTIYIHHDGYPNGAASYFYGAFLAGGHLSPESMIRGNDRAELTDSHEAHGDTEYRYTITGETLRVDERMNFSENWRVIYNGDWLAFVNREATYFDGEFSPLVRVKVGQVEKVYSRTMLDAELNEKLRLLGMWTVGAYKDQPDAYNMIYLKREVADLQAAQPSNALLDAMAGAA